MSATEFYNKYIGKKVDLDNAAGVQCVDLFKVFTKDNYGIYNYSTGNGWASGLWINRKIEPYYDKFTDSNINKLQNGDWVIWGKGSRDCPNSHVAMYYDGKFFGQNQNGRRAASLATISLDGVIGVLRPKIYIQEDSIMVKKIKEIQKYLNRVYNFRLNIDGVAGTHTLTSLIKALQMEINKQFECRLNIDGVFGPVTKSKCPSIDFQDEGNIVWLAQAELSIKGYLLTLDGKFGGNTRNKTIEYQKNNKLNPDGIIGPKTFEKLFKYN